VIEPRMGRADRIWQSTFIFRSSGTIGNNRMTVAEQAAANTSVDVYVYGGHMTS